MSHLVLGNIWYLLLAVLWIGFVILESLTSGIGMVFRTAKGELEGKTLQYTAGPYWDGSQVWLITAGGGTFAAFPEAFASMFSNLYVALFLLLIMLIVRGVSMELVYKDDNPKWQICMGTAWMIAGYGVALLLGVRLVNLFISANTLESSTNSFLALLSKVGILGGVLFISFYRTNGILWANIKAKGDVVTRLLKQLMPTAIITALIIPILMMAFNWRTNLFTTNFKVFPVLWVLPISTMVAPILTIMMIVRKKYGLAFVFNNLVMVLFLATGYIGNFPYIVPGITVEASMASEKALTIMTIVVAVCLPFVLGYQSWKFYRFRKKLETSYFK